MEERELCLLDVTGCGTCASCTTPATGVPVAKANMAAAQTFLVFIDKCLFWLITDVADTRQRAQRKALGSRATSG